MDDVDASAAARRLAAAEREALLPQDTTPLLPARRKRATAVATMVLGLLALSVGVTVVHQRLEKEQKLDVDRDAAWTAFKAKYEKTYATPAHEKAARRNYEARLASMDERNRINGEAVFGVTRHADREMGHNAFARGHRRAERRDILNLKPIKTKTISKIDWRETEGVISPVKNQGQCGSCWAFAVTEQVESQLVLSGAPQVTLSPQQLASCTADAEGCGGGDPGQAYAYLASLNNASGLAPDAWWPYEQSLTPDDACTSKDCTEACDRDPAQLEGDYQYVGPYARIHGYGFATDECTQGDCAHQNTTELMLRLHDAPVAVCLNAEHWDDYVGGVLTADACGGNGANDIDHCVQLVGYDSAGGWFLVRNSWSTSWGEDGYLRLAIDGNACGVANEATVAVVEEGE